MSDEPTTEEVSDEAVVVDQAGGAANNPMYIALAAIVAIGVMFLAWTFAISPILLGGDADGADEPDVVAQPTPQDAQDEPVSPEATPDPGIEEDDLDEPPVGAVEVFLARDPFRSVRPDEPAPAPAGDPGGPTPTDPTAPGAPTDPTAPTGPTDPGAPTDPTDPTDPSAPGNGNGNGDQVGNGGDRDTNEDRTTVEGRRYELVDVRLENGRPRAVMNIDGESYTVSEGDVFLSDPQVAIREIDADAQCVIFLHGDQRQRLCEGEAVLK